jgi:hypothetical protein
MGCHIGRHAASDPKRDQALTIHVEHHFDHQPALLSSSPCCPCFRLGHLHHLTTTPCDRSNGAVYNATRRAGAHLWRQCIQPSAMFPSCCSCAPSKPADASKRHPRQCHTSQHHRQPGWQAAPQPTPEPTQRADRISQQPRCVQAAAHGMPAPMAITDQCLVLQWTGAGVTQGATEPSHATKVQPTRVLPQSTAPPLTTPTLGITHAVGNTCAPSHTEHVEHPTLMPRLGKHGAGTAHRGCLQRTLQRLQHDRGCHASLQCPVGSAAR